MARLTAMLPLSAVKRFRPIGEFPLPWSSALAALLRSIILVAGTIVAATLLGGVTFYLVVAILCVLAFARPAYANAQRTEALVKLSLTDSLTGLGNRRAIEARLDEEIARCSRGRYSVAVLMIDVDKLKTINDESGHRMGDRVLRAVAASISRSTRISDVSGRLGGDEFLVIAPQTNRSAACALAERIAADVRKIRLLHDGLPPVSVSVGVASVASTNAERAELLELADRAVYEAKASGGDRVVGSIQGPILKAVPMDHVSDR